MKKIFLATFTIAAFVVSSCKNETESVNKEVENAKDSLKMDTLSMENSTQFDGIYKVTLLRKSVNLFIMFLLSILVCV